MTVYAGWALLWLGPAWGPVAMAAVPALAAAWLPGPMGLGRLPWRWCLLAWLGAAAFGLAALGLAWTLGLAEPSLDAFAAELSEQRGTRAALAASDARTLALAHVAAAVASPLIYAPLSVLEEVGWRGALVRAASARGRWTAMLVSGALWGLWVGPVLVPGEPAVAAMAGVTWGAWLGWLRLASDSVWPAVLARGTLTGLAGLAPLFAVDAVHGPFGWPAWVLVGSALAIARTRRTADG